MNIMIRQIIALLAVSHFGGLYGVQTELAAQDTTKRHSRRVLVVVNGQPITQGDLNFLMLSRRVVKHKQSGLRKQFLEHLIDNRLLQSFLAQRKAKPNEKQLDSQIKFIYKIIRQSGDDPTKVLASLGYTKQTLRNELALPLAWKSYVNLIVTGKQLRDYWKQHRHEFDGTEVCAAHIAIKASSKSEIEAAKVKLRQVRSDIGGGKVTFAQSAKEYSQSPSRIMGGDLGFFSYRGKMPLIFSQTAFPLKVGQVSQPFRTQFGIHILTTTARKPGQLSLEDARIQLLEQLAKELRHDLIQRERTKAKIEWKIEVE